MRITKDEISSTVLCCKCKQPLVESSSGLFCCEHDLRHGSLLRIGEIARRANRKSIRYAKLAPTALNATKVTTPRRPARYKIDGKPGLYSLCSKENDGAVPVRVEHDNGDVSLFYVRRRDR